MFIRVFHPRGEMEKGKKLYALRVLQFVRTYTYISSKENVDIWRTVEKLSSNVYLLKDFKVKLLLPLQITQEENFDECYTPAIKVAGEGCTDKKGKYILKKYMQYNVIVSFPKYIVIFQSTFKSKR